MFTKVQSHKMLTHTKTVWLLFSRNCLNVFNHFMGFGLKGFRINLRSKPFKKYVIWKGEKGQHKKSYRKRDWGSRCRWKWGGRGGGVNGKKMAHHDKKFCLTSYIRKCASYDHMIVAFSTPA